MAFSKISIIELIHAFRFISHAEIETFKLRFNLEEANLSGSLKNKKVAIIEFLINNPNLIGPNGANLTFEIAECFFDRWREQPTHDFELIYPKLLRSLRRDGYTIENGKLKRILPETIEIEYIENELFSLLDEFELTTAKGHINQAISAHARGDHAGANAQIRTFIEEMFDFISFKLEYEKAQSLKTSHDRRELLFKMKPPFFKKELNEWDEKGNGFIKGFWKRLQPEGSHPGLSNDDDSSFRLQLALLVAHYFLKRFKTFSKET